MKKVLIILSFVAVAAFIAIAAQPDDRTAAKNESAKPAQAPPNGVIISDYEYQPGNITVKAGTKVTWTNEDTAQHTVTLEGEGEGPKSERFGKGQSYSYTFMKAGTYKYFCEPHPYMKASVEVTE